MHVPADRIAAVGARPLLAIAALAAALRLAGAIPDFYHFYDEVWQYLEPAYGTVHDRWIVTWEYREGIRSWLLPTMLAVPFAAAAGLGIDAHPAIVAIRMLLALLSLGIVVAGAAIAARMSRGHALAAALVLATSFELVLFAARPLSEAVATSLILPAAALLVDAERRTPRRLAAAGLLVALAVVIRFQLAPMLAALAILTLRADRRGWTWLLAGAAIGLAADAIANGVRGDIPFRWMVDNVRLNFAAGVSERYGTMPPWWYAEELLRLWGPFALPIVALVAIGARRVPVLVAVALVNIAFHSVIAHKELRFVYPSMPLLLIAAAVGAVDLARAARADRWRRPATVAAALIFTGVSAHAALSAIPEERVLGRAQIALWRAAHAEPGLCGFASLADRPGLISSRAFIDRAAPIYMFAGEDRVAAFRQARAAFDVATAGEARIADMRAMGYALRGCIRSAAQVPSDFCLFRRPGGCGQGDPRYLENAVLARTGR